MGKLTHINENGEAAMVDIGNKVASSRIARAYGSITMQHDTFVAMQSQSMKKGDVFAVARIAGIMAAKQTEALIPLCHGVALSSVAVNFYAFDEGSVASEAGKFGFHCLATANTYGQTGVEMEALIAVSIALLTMYDMGKAIDRFMKIGGITLIEKQGGKSGHWLHPEKNLSKWAIKSD